MGLGFMGCSFITNISTLTGKTDLYEIWGSYTVVAIKICWDVMLCHWASSFFHFREPKWLHLKGHLLDKKAEGPMTLWNIGNHWFATQCHIHVLEDLSLLNRGVAVCFRSSYLARLGRTTWEILLWMTCPSLMEAVQVSVTFTLWGRCCWECINWQ
jgi:hypothetical protein